MFNLCCLLLYFIYFIYFIFTFVLKEDGLRDLTFLEFGFFFRFLNQLLQNDYDFILLLLNLVFLVNLLSIIQIFKKLFVEMWYLESFDLRNVRACCTFLEWYNSFKILLYRFNFFKMLLLLLLKNYNSIFCLLSIINSFLYLLHLDQA